jgi:predicted nucleic acid-binding protein
MRICIDSCAFIHALQESDPDAAHLLDEIGSGLTLVIPRLVAQEVTRNLQTPEQVRRFYRLFRATDFAWIVDEPTPRDLVEKYTQLGLPEKADAFIGAFSEWMEVRCLISDNRHFLRELHTSAFVVLQAGEFRMRWKSGEF